MGPLIVTWGQDIGVEEDEVPESEYIPQVCWARDELRASLLAGLWRGEQGDAPRDTGAQRQVYSVLCCQLMALLTLIHSGTHTHCVHFLNSKKTLLLAVVISFGNHFLP